MFWGLILGPKMIYSQNVDKPFHISMATLDLETSCDGYTQVICSVNKENFLLCTLQKPGLLQCPLDLEFSVGDEISFTTSGKAHVHLTGYLTGNDDDEGMALEYLVEEEEQSDNVDYGSPSKKRTLKENGTTFKSSKKPKLENGTSIEDIDVEEDSDDEDFVVAEEDESEEDDSEEEENLLEEVEQLEEAEEPVIEEEKISKKIKRKLKKLQEQPMQLQVTQPNAEPSLESGVIVKDLVQGSGPRANNGRYVAISYEGRLQKNNKVFDKTTKRSGFKFQLGMGEVIKGLDIGILGMKKNGTRKIICPPQTAYGTKGILPTIPPNSTLVFTVTLNEIK